MTNNLLLLNSCVRPCRLLFSDWHNRFRARKFRGCGSSLAGDTGVGLRLLRLKLVVLRILMLTVCLKHMKRCSVRLLNGSSVNRIEGGQFPVCRGQPGCAMQGVELTVARRPPITV